MSILRRYAMLFSRTFKLSLASTLIYRSNVVFFLVFEAVFYAAQFLAVSIGYDLAGHEIAGWTRSQAYLLTSVSSLSHQLFICFFVGPIFGVAAQVWSGQYDYILLKPLHPLSSMFFNGSFVIANLPNLAFCCGGVAYFAWQTGGQWSWAQLLLFLTLLVFGVGLRIALALLCMAPVFYSERLADIEQSFWSVASLGRYPLEIYPWWLRVLFTFVIPIGMMASLPAAVLSRPYDAAAMGLAAAAGLAFIGACVWVFMHSLRRYQSVNSG